MISAQLYIYIFTVKAYHYKTEKFILQIFQTFSVHGKVVETTFSCIAHLLY